MARYASEAERLRAHRTAFLLAQELNCTPKEAEAELARRAAHARWEQAEQKLAARTMRGPRPSQMTAEIAPEERAEPWMMRD